MAREIFGPLDTGDIFPELTFATLNGIDFTLPKDLTEWTVFLVYRYNT